MDNLPIPDRLKALINAVRGVGGMGQQQSPGRAVTAAGGFRDANMLRQEQGLPPLTPEEYMQQMQQMPVSTPR